MKPPQSVNNARQKPQVTRINGHLRGMGSTNDKRRILIVGSGVFGLSTAHAYLHSPNARNIEITIIDARPFPSHESSSNDSSRIVRSDYKDPLYARLGADALKIWRGAPGTGNLGLALTKAEREGKESERVYWQCGLTLVYNDDEKERKVRKGKDEEYVKKSMDNARHFEGPDAVRVLHNFEEIKKVQGTGGGSGDWGYVNLKSGFVNAERAMVVLREEVARRESRSIEDFVSKKKVRGVKTKDGKVYEADLVVFATGAWTPSLLDVGGNAMATGQVIAYLDITEEEQKKYENMPVILNLTDGTFVIPPRDRILKVAAHTNGYRNTVETRYGKRSVPVTHLSNPKLVFPKAAEALLHKAINENFPALVDRPFSGTRICWYTDTPTGDFLVDYHPKFQNLFVATGGSGHAFKFLPVLGDEIVKIIEAGPKGSRRNTPQTTGVKSETATSDEGYKEAWKWRKTSTAWTGDGSRGGQEEGDGELFPNVPQEAKVEVIKAKL
ncbi:DAO-domain-containing protein [Ascobolus immersus RN42]|uniref:DAO-domain-containing protein n=1 Tax=Ascobolus immersus RN42 TaxID=1160509 RepID=A0A3N4INJ0_ASCIM|nr:DAO-domain-containing protein [Ascobolus immersus RN42]